MEKPDGVVQLLIASVIVIALLPSFLSIGPAAGDAVLTAATGERVTLDSTQQEIPSRVSVDATTGNALYFDGESYVESGTPGNFAAGSWTVCVSARLDPDANQKATYTAYAYDNASVLLQRDAGNWVVYYDNGTHDGKSTVAAPASSDFVPVCGAYDVDTDELVIAADGDRSSSTLTSETTPRNLSQNWVGSLEEVRTFDDFSDRQLDQYATDPIQPLPDSNRTSRMMFDEGDGSTTKVYFADGAATIYGASWTDGISGPDLEEGVDYELFENPFEITFLSDGYLDGAPVQYVSRSPLIPFNVISLMGLLFGLFILVTFANRIRDLM